MKLDRSAFLTWLQAKRPDEIIGRGGDICGCPIARYHAEASGGHEVTVTDSDSGIRIDRGDGARLAPLWVERFVRAVDDEPGKRDITACRAIELVEATCAGSGGA